MTLMSIYFVTYCYLSSTPLGTNVCLKTYRLKILLAKTTTVTRNSENIIAFSHHNVSSVLWVHWLLRE
jgi:hypothetical protein